ncbi:hypothetical protein [Trujillonella endophytica]|uniref:Uncharacterized protein n=1 Tax=Trujillonella endophytica TaxID=673521 RepID=A0A1H8S1S2_9ACTN|nr:hypothetical protein [Trujillella endophytica]SEO72394.1 hypothetical protein SAMN05660991_01478 [Trujillella endophytica]
MTTDHPAAPQRGSRYDRQLSPRPTLSRAVALRNEAIQMYGYEYDLACDRLAELRTEADTATRMRRLRAARRWARRAEYARLRAARASAAVR